MSEPGPLPPPLPPRLPPPLPLSPLPLGYAEAVARPRVWTVFLAFVCGLLGAVSVSGIAMGLWAAVHGVGAGGMREMMETALSSPAFVLGMMAGTVASSLIVAIGAAKLSAAPTARRLGWNPSRAGWGAVGVMMVGAAAVGMASGMVVGMLEKQPEGSLKLLGETIGRLNGPEIVLAYLLIAVGAGFSEELLFRGYIQTRLRLRIGIVWAVVVTAALFAAMHMDKVQSPAVLGLGLYLGWVRERTGSVKPAIACHAFNNAAAITGALLSGGSDGTPAGTPGMMMGGAVVFASVAGACIVWASALIRAREARLTPATASPALEG